MEKLQMPEYGHLSEEDWSYFLSFNSQQYVLSVDKSLRTENRFFVDNRFNKLLNYYTAASKAIGEFEYIIPKDSVLFRARIYDEPNAEEKAKDAIDGEFNGYGKDGSFVPPLDKHCSQGRINPDGIRYLYLASTADCAVQEVTPVLKSWVSVAKIRFRESARVFNLAKAVLSSTFDDNQKSLWAMGVMSCLSSLFSKPYGKDGDYLICQYVSEFIKNVGYDGIRFFSSRVMQKYCDESYVNYTIFNYNKCEPISSDLLYVFGSHLETKSYMQLEAVTYHGEVE
ncbi:MAG: RES domain-containing protein [Clostridia bacterium]|nr:RES domain-containing protein [Clostridia bacterium]